MIERITLLLGLCITVFISGCTTSVATVDEKPRIQRLILLNESDVQLEDVRIFVTRTRELVTCGAILPRSECSTGFPLREYQGNPFDISWMEYQRAMLARDIQVTVPETLLPGQRVNAVIVFRGDGRFSARLVPADTALDPGRAGYR